MVVRGGLGPVERRTTSSIISDLIRSRIADGTFPAGSQLTEVELARELDVSRGPVREGLQRLIQEGLLESRPHRGVFVVALDDEDVADVYLARKSIERAAAQEVVRRRDPAVLEQLGALVRQMSQAARTKQWEDVAELDRRFHEALVTASGSKRLSRMYRTLLAETQMCLAALEPAYPARNEIAKEHRELLDALRHWDEASVLRAIDAHLDRAVRDLGGRQ